MTRRTCTAASVILTVMLSAIPPRVLSSEPPEPPATAATVTCAAGITGIPDAAALVRKIAPHPRLLARDNDWTALRTRIETDPVRQKHGSHARPADPVRPRSRCLGVLRFHPRHHHHASLAFSARRSDSCWLRCPPHRINRRWSNRCRRNDAAHDMAPGVPGVCRAIRAH